MQDYLKILRMHHEGQSQRAIAISLNISRNTVSEVIKRFKAIDLCFEKISYMDNNQLGKLLYPNNHNEIFNYTMPDFEYIHKELLKPGVTLKLLHDEYVASCKRSNKPYFKSTAFKNHYREYVSKNSLTMHISHKPAKKMMVDWAGTTMEVVDRYTGEVFKAYIFVATLPFSMYTYIEATPDMKIANWLLCHVHAYEYFGGVTKILVPDNLKTGVISNKKYEDPNFNKAYQEMADYYGTAIIPARVRKPKDKAAVEGSVGVVTNSIIGRLRNRKFFTFEELNKALHKELEIFNTNPFQKREGSRYECFIEEEKDFLEPLPSTPYELSVWKRSKVNINYHITIDRMNYSVPYKYVGKYVDVKLSQSQVKVYYDGTLICSHNHLYGRNNQYSTNEDHMPEDHRLFEWNGNRFRSWALSIGKYTYEVIDRLLNKYKIEEQAYKGCLSILKLQERYTPTRLEDACQLAIENLAIPSYKNIKMILESNQDLAIRKSKEEQAKSNKYALLRGEEYYGNKD